jgi:hypothetical protein
MDAVFTIPSAISFVHLALEENWSVGPRTQKGSATLTGELLIQIVVDPFVRATG